MSKKITIVTEETLNKEEASREFLTKLFLIALKAYDLFYARSSVLKVEIIHITTWNVPKSLLKTKDDKPAEEARFKLVITIPQHPIDKDITMNIIVLWQNWNPVGSSSLPPSLPQILNAEEVDEIFSGLQVRLSDTSEESLAKGLLEVVKAGIKLRAEKKEEEKSKLLKVIQAI